MSDLSTQLQQLMRQMMAPQQLMNIETGIDGKQGGAPPGGGSQMKDWQSLVSPPKATPNYTDIPKRPDGTPDIDAIKPAGTPGFLENMGSVVGAKNIPQGIAAASKLVGK